MNFSTASFGGEEVKGSEVVGFMQDACPGAGVKKSGVGMGQDQGVPGCGIFQRIDWVDWGVQAGSNQ